MADPQVLTLLAQLGVATPLIGILMWLLRASDAERRDVTTKFLATLESTIKSNAEGGASLSTALHEISRTVAERTAATTLEHQKIMEGLSEIAREVRRPEYHTERKRND